jgi:hypothetical protein
MHEALAKASMAFLWLFHGASIGSPGEFCRMLMFPSKSPDKACDVFLPSYRRHYPALRLCLVSATALLQQAHTDVAVGHSRKGSSTLTSFCNRLGYVHYRMQCLSAGVAQSQP